MFETNCHINIYDELKELKDSFASLQLYVEKLEKMIVKPIRIAERSDDEDCEDFWTVPKILKQYHISKQTLRNWKKIVPLNPIGRVGRFDRYSIQDVKDFIDKILKKKNEFPSLFPSPFKKAI
jgi:hypothetical protein